MKTRGDYWLLGSIMFFAFFFILFMSLIKSTRVEGSEPMAFDDKQVVRCIIGESANQQFIGMVAVGEGIRNRGHLEGVWGCKAKHIDDQPEWVWFQARFAWKESEHTNLVKGADMWENIKDYGYPIDWPPCIFIRKINDHYFFRRIKSS